MDVLERLREGAGRAFRGEPVVFAYLFGSHVGGKTHRRSDVDVAVYIDDAVPPERYLDLRLKLPDRLTDATGVHRIEVAVLNELPLRIRGRALQRGTVIFSRDEPKRCEHYSLTLRQLFDFQIHSRPLDASLLEAMARRER